mgnify:CR=1 FL=1
MEQGKCGVEHAILPEKGIVVAGECIIGVRQSYMYLWGIRSFFYRCRTTDIATGMATGELVV